MVKTGKKLTTVVATAVKTAPPISEVALRITPKVVLIPFSILCLASSRCFNIFSETIIPISTMVPMAMAIPDRATILASTPKSFIPTKTIRTVKGSRLVIRKEDFRCINMTKITMMVIKISSRSACFRVPNVS